MISHSLLCGPTVVQYTLLMDPMKYISVRWRSRYYASLGNNYLQNLESNSRATHLREEIADLRISPFLMSRKKIVWMTHFYSSATMPLNYLLFDMLTPYPTKMKLFPVAFTMTCHLAV